SNAREPAYGYARENGLDHIVEEEAEVVRLAFETYATSLYTQADIAKLLTKKGYRTRRTDTRWGRSTVEKMLGNPFYYGVVRYRDNLYPGQHEPIISKELWDEVQKARAANVRCGGTRRRGSKPVRFYLLHRVARCWHCRKRMHMHTDSRWGRSYYKDPAALLGYDCVSFNRVIRVDRIDATVEDTIRLLKLPQDWQDRILATANHKDQKKKIEDRRGALEAKLKRLKYLYLEDDIGVKEYEAQKADINEELASLQMPEDSNIVEAGQMLESLAVLWDDLTPREKQEILRSMLRAIYIDIEEQRVVCYEPFAEFAPLFDQIEALSEKDGCYYRSEVPTNLDKSGKEDA
ncbi:recombinase family protein, partial [Chloroflexota bacterium]